MNKNKRGLIVVDYRFLDERPDAVPKCPRCGSREWAPLPPSGKFMAYCKHCLKQVDMANWRKE